jgi:putative thioredoxin
MTISEVQRSWIREVNYEQFDGEVLQLSQYHPVLVDFWAEWGSPCLVIGLLLKLRVVEYAGFARLAKVEVDAAEKLKLAGRYRVRGFPTLMLFRKGEPLDHFSGARPVRYIRDFLEQHGRQAAAD